MNSTLIHSACKSQNDSVARNQRYQWILTYLSLITMYRRGRAESSNVRSCMVREEVGLLLC